MSAPANLHQISARIFVDICKTKFGWNDLSKDIIMDVGCGEEVFCSKSILEKFPEVGTIIAIDGDLKVVRKIKSNPIEKIRCDIGDIEKRCSLQKYEGKMTKVVSTHTFHQLMNKKVAFENVYHLLQPGGEAAILFVTKSLIYEWLTEMLKISKWKEIFEGHYVVDLYSEELGMPQYREMVQNIGFRVVDCIEDKRVIPYPTDEECKNALVKISGNSFKVPPESVEEFKEDSFRIILELGGRNEEGKPCYRSTEIYLLLVKPAEESCSTVEPSTET